MTGTKPTPRRLLKLIERAQLLREDVRQLSTWDEATVTPEGLQAYNDMITAVASLHAWNDALRATPNEGDAS